MSNLRTQDKDPKRYLTWQGKSIAVCSRKELVECVIELARQLGIANKRLLDAERSQVDKIALGQLERAGLKPEATNEQSV